MRDDRNDMAYWFPRLQASGAPVPKTQLVRTTVQLADVLDGKMPDGYKSFLADLTCAVEHVGLPCFLRTGQGSNKHAWRRSCYLSELEHLPSHIANLVEWSQCVDFFGLSYSTWAVRELLPIVPAFHAFRGNMPVTRERRFFFEGGDNPRAICSHPYWPRAAIEDPDRDDWMPLLDALNDVPELELRDLARRTEEVALHFGGYWSIDWLHTLRGWYAIDMAEGQRSFHWPGCPQNRTPAQPAPKPRNVELVRKFDPQNPFAE